MNPQRHIEALAKTLGSRGQTPGIEKYGGRHGKGNSVETFGGEKVTGCGDHQIAIGWHLFSLLAAPSFTHGGFSVRAPVRNEALRSVTAPVPAIGS